MSEEAAHVAMAASSPLGEKLVMLARRKLAAMKPLDDLCGHGCGSCGEEWLHSPAAQGVPCPMAGTVNRFCPPCVEKDRLEAIKERMERKRR